MHGQSADRLYFETSQPQSGKPMIDSNTDSVAQYYDANTKRFLATSSTGQAVAIHRKLWAPGIDTPEAAAAHINDLVAQTATSILGYQPQAVTDLGCGVGGSLFHLARVWPTAQLTGYTLSQAQVQIAQTLSAQRDLQNRCLVKRADFTKLCDPVPSELVIAIESHTHLSGLDLFFEAARRHLQPNGLLVVVDDMLASDESSLTSQDRSRVAAFKRGWRLGHLPSIQQFLDQARAHGFDVVACEDLGGFLRLNEPWDRMLKWVAPALDVAGLARIPMFANMIGGNALTQCHRRGLMRYMMIGLRT